MTTDNQALNSEAAQRCVRRRCNVEPRYSVSTSLDQREDIRTCGRHLTWLLHWLSLPENGRHQVVVVTGSKTHGGPDEFDWRCNTCHQQWPCVTYRLADALEAQHAPADTTQIRDKIARLIYERHSLSRRTWSEFDDDAVHSVYERTADAVMAVVEPLLAETRALRGRVEIIETASIGAHALLKDAEAENEALRKEIAELKTIRHGDPAMFGAMIGVEIGQRDAESEAERLTAENDALREENETLRLANATLGSSRPSEVQRLRSVIDQATKLADELEAEAATDHENQILDASPAVERDETLRYAAARLRRVLAVPETTQDQETRDGD